MKRIAVTYENGEVFQHFGHTEEFKVYEVEDGKIINSEIIGSNGSGHGALAGILDEKKIDVLICGGIGGGAQAALAERGIELCAGASGSADEAVKAYLSGELVNTGANCNHHGEGHSCGEHSCGDHDEHSCGGCGNSTISGKNVGKTCQSTVAAPVRSNDFTVNDPTIFHFVDFEFLSMTEVLEFIQDIHSRSQFIRISYKIQSEYCLSSWV